MRDLLSLMMGELATVQASGNLTEADKAERIHTIIESYKRTVFQITDVASASLKSAHRLERLDVEKLFMGAISELSRNTKTE